MILHKTLADILLIVRIFPRHFGAWKNTTAILLTIFPSPKVARKNTAQLAK